MKTVALLIYAETLESTVAECRRQIDLIPTDEYTFELFVNPDLDEAWRAAGDRDFYIWLHGLVTPVEGALYNLLDRWSLPFYREYGCAAVWRGGTPVGHAPSLAARVRRNPNSAVTPRRPMQPSHVKITCTLNLLIGPPGHIGVLSPVFKSDQKHVICAITQ